VADRRFGYVFVLVWFLLGTSVHLLFFVHFGIYGLLSNHCLVYIQGGDVGVGVRGDCLLPVN
jgi:hypothetical protein